MARHVSGLDPRIVHEIQHIDVVRQTIEALAAFSSEVSQQLPTGCTVDPGVALQPVKLSALVGKLARPAPAAVDGRLVHGEIELFD